MALSYLESEASGSTDVFTVPPYLDKSHITVALDGINVAPEDLTWLTAQTVQLPETPAAGVLVIRSRSTPIDAPLVTLSPGNINSGTLQRLSLQNLYIAQERAEVGDLGLAQLEALAAAATAAATEATEAASGSVRFNAVQTLSSGEKAQARANIGADALVSYGTSQSLLDSQKVLSGGPVRT